MGRYLMLVGLVTLCACAGNHPSYSDRVASWRGKQVSDLVSAVGAPTTSTKLPDGSTVYGYTRGGVGSAECHTSFIADASGVVTSTTSDGMGCF